MAGTIRGTANGIRAAIEVSMESGLDGRNNAAERARVLAWSDLCLNGVRPRWPEQCDVSPLHATRP